MLKNRTRVFRPILWTLVPFLATFVLFYPFTGLGVDPHHDGLMFKTAMDVWSGQTLFKDTFTQYGALSTYLHAAALGALGPKLFSIRLLTTLAYCLSATFLVLSWRRLFSDVPECFWLVLVSWLTWIAFTPFFSSDWPMLPWSSVLALCFQSAVLYLLLSALYPSRLRAGYLSAGLSGVCVALTFWSRTPVGIVTGAAVASCLVLWWIKSRDRRILWLFLFFLTGILATNAAFLVIIRASGAWDEWIYQTFIWPRQWVNGFTGGGLTPIYRSLFYSPFGNPKYEWLKLLLFIALFFSGVIRKSVPHWIRAVTFLICVALGLSLRAEMISTVSSWAIAIPVAVLTAALILTLKDQTSFLSNGPFILTATVAVAAWFQYFPLSCPRHIFWGISPAIGGFVWILFRLCRRNAPVAALIVMIMFVPLLYSKYNAAKANLMAGWIAFRDIPELTGMYAQSPEHEKISALANRIAFFKAHAGHDLAMHIDGPDALWGTMVPDTANASPIFVRWRQVIRESDPAQRHNFITRKRPLILVDERQFPELADMTIREFDYKRDQTFDFFQCRLVLLVPSETLKQSIAY